MCYWPWAKSASKEWLPKEGPIALLRQVPPGRPALLKPALLKPDLRNVLWSKISEIMWKSCGSG